MNKIASLPKPPMNPKERLETVTKIVDLLDNIPESEIMPIMGMVGMILGANKKGGIMDSLIDKKAHWCILSMTQITGGVLFF